MGFPPSALENPKRILFGFNEGSKTSLGNVVLPVQVGPVIQNVQLSVVEDLSPFNAIMGRTWLHGMKVIPSTYHQMLVECHLLLGWIVGSHVACHLVPGCMETPLKGAPSRFAPVHLQQLGLERGSREKKCRFEVEVDKLLATGFIKKVEYPDWLANVVVVPKKWESGESMMLSFINTFSGYHQIPMFQPDEEKIVFVTPHRLYCYKVMPFGLKNVGAT
ncbi:hypothetical protein CK203_055247 [Vitis vinifera]|uniref:Transposon Ty3-I Gag-Pol polyprotein n=1 Tax=Vitis vinifera TaxID=29760 RepID=A0A438GTW3_VITVI|nr:hypothetical protein CK203_055247 [Vitis vinifera]